MKNLKALLAVLFSAALVLNFVPAQAEAAPADNTAYLAYADGSWTYQYWGDPVETGVVGKNAVITGPGQYTVGLDFTGTADGKAKGLSFTAPMIVNGNVNFPGYFIQLDSIVINGAKVKFTKNYTSSDDGKEMRSNIYNSWVGALPDDARTPDGSLDGASAVIVDTALFAEVKTISVTFTFLDAEGNAGAPAEEAAPVEEEATPVEEEEVVLVEEEASDEEAAPAEEVAATAEETAEPAAAAVPKTGVASLALIYGLGAMATGAFVLKKKEK